LIQVFRKGADKDLQNILHGRAYVMNEMRQFKRVRFKAKCSLSHNNISYLGQMENISLNGALISFSDGVVIPRNESCSLTVYLEEENSPLRLTIEVIHSNFTMIGIKFVSNDAEMQERLQELIERLTTGQEKLVNEQQLYCREYEG
jgi:hypothetical protein